jgi:NADH:ubiquinone oxidoreductase subunit K
VRIFNQYSFLAAAVFLIGLIAVLANRARARQGAYLVLALVVLAILVAWYFLRPTSSSLADTAEIQAQIGSGVPVLLEFQSPY